MQLNEHNFNEILAESKHKVVFIYFYDQDPSCAQCTTALRSAISDTNEYITLVEADMDTNFAQGLAMQIGLRGLPALLIFKDQRPYNVIQGPDIVKDLPTILNEFMPSEADLLLQEAEHLEHEGKLVEALDKASSAYKLAATDLECKHYYIHLLLANKQVDKAQELLSTAGREEQESPSYNELQSALNLALKAQESPLLDELKLKYEQDSSNEQVAIDYAIALKESGQNQKALDLLFAILEQDMNKSEVKKIFIDMLNTMAADPLKSEYRRKLYTLMY